MIVSIDKVFWLLVFCTLLAGCATPGKQKGSMDDSRPYRTGFNRLDRLDTGYFVTVGKRDQKWSVLDIRYGRTRPERNGSDEVLYVGPDGTYVQPAFDWVGAENNGYFNCMALMGTDAAKGKGYSPCGDTSLAKIDLAGTALRNLFWAPMTWGAATGSNRAVDAKALAEVVDQTQVLATVRTISEAIDALDAERQRAADAFIADSQRALDAAAITVLVLDSTGLFTEKEKISKMVKKTLPAEPQMLRFLPREALQRGTSEQILARIKEHRAKVATASAQAQHNISLPIECQSRVWQGFSVSLVCPASVSVLPGSPPPAIPVTAEIQWVELGSVYPRMAVRDANLSVESDGTGLSLANHSQTSHLEIAELSVYYDREVSTKRYDPPISLPPSAKTSVPIPIDSIAGAVMKIVSRVDKYTDELGARSSINFGLAAKYGRSGDVPSKSLYQTKTFVMRDVVRERRPDVRSTIKQGGS